MKSTLPTLLVLSTFSFIGTAHAQNGWAVLDTTLYSIQYPAEWELDQDGEMGASFFIFSPLESEADEFSENVNLVMEDLTGYDVDLDMYTELASQQIAATIENFSLLKSERINREDKAYQRVVYSGTLDAIQLTFEQRFFVANETAYVITFSSETGQYEKYEALSRQILDTFVLK